MFKKLALLHPRHFEELSLPEYVSVLGIRKEVQGRRSFGNDGLSASCQSELLWGYGCPLRESAIHQDHLFPYSLGGPTDGGNRVALCRYHNMVKTCDIHYFPWEETDVRCDPWLDHQVQKLFTIAFSRYS